MWICAKVVKNELEEITQDETRHNGVDSRTTFGSCEGEKRLTFFPSICVLELMSWSLGIRSVTEIGLTGMLQAGGLDQGLYLEPPIGEKR